MWIIIPKQAHGSRSNNRFLGSGTRGPGGGRWGGGWRLTVPGRFVDFGAVHLSAGVATPAHPAPRILAAFGLEGVPVPLPGGRGRSWRVGWTVLKPLDMAPSLVRWHADLLTGLDGRDEFRVSVPLSTTDGEWSSDGWTAWRYQPGEHLSGRWHDIVEVGRRLHRALRTEPEPVFLQNRTDYWAVGDRVAWNELPAEDCAGTKHLATLIPARRPTSGRSQLVHGDLTGNVLFHPHLPPLVIDLSPYWRPPEFASAVVTADALVFEGANNDIVQPMLQDPDFPQYLLRALIFRVVADHFARPHLHHDDNDDPYGPAVDLAVHLSELYR